MADTLLITSRFPPEVGGNGRWMWELYSRLPLGKFLVAAHQGVDLGDFDGSSDLPIIRLPLKLESWGALGWPRGLRYYRVYSQLSRIVVQHRIRSIHASNCLPEGFLAWMLNFRHGLPYLVFVHGEELNIVGKSRELKWMTQRVFQRASTIIANSRNTAKLLCKDWSVSPDRVQVMHPGVDTNRFRPAAVNSSARERLGWAERPVILTVGRFQERKGQEQVVRALPEIRRHIPDVLYALVGDGRERAKLERIIAVLGLQDHVRLHGEMTDDDLILAYQQCDLFAMPNLEVNGDFEGFGIVFLEAQACGKPVIAGNSGGTDEAVNVPFSGRIVRANQTSELAQTIIDLLRDEPLRAKMGRAGRRWVETRFDWQILAAQALQIFYPGAERQAPGLISDGALADEFDDCDPSPSQPAITPNETVKWH